MEQIKIKGNKTSCNNGCDKDMIVKEYNDDNQDL